MATELLQAGRDSVQWDVEQEANAALFLAPALAIIVDVVDSVTSYVGKAKLATATSAATWQISRVVTSGTGGVTMTWADGDGLFDNVWDDRASLSYS